MKLEIKKKVKNTKIQNNIKIHKIIKFTKLQSFTGNSLIKKRIKEY